MLSSNQISAETEARVLTSLLATGLTVSVPFGVARYDLILELDGRFLRIQCKTGRLKDGYVLFNACSAVGSRGRNFTRRSYQDDADLFGVYCSGTEQVYLIPVENKTAISLRVSSPRNGQKKGIRLAADYEVKQFIENERKQSVQGV